MINGTRFRIEMDISRQSGLAARIARGQSDIASKTRLQAASDDPAASARVAILRRQDIDVKAWVANADSAASTASRADSALGALGVLLDRARELMTGASSETLNDADRAGIASELNGLADEVENLSGETDASGARVFPTAALRVSVGSDLTLAATTTIGDAFTAQTASGNVGIASILRNAGGALALGAAARAVQMANVISASDHLSAVRGEQGIRAVQIDRARDRLVAVRTSGAEERDGLEATDIPDTIARIQGDQLTLDAAQALFAKVNRRTLFDLLG
jgi:flagellar hook-associated protein 3 FlgL